MLATINVLVNGWIIVFIILINTSPSGVAEWADQYDDHQHISHSRVKINSVPQVGLSLSAETKRCTPENRNLVSHDFEVVKLADKTLDKLESLRCVVCSWNVITYYETKNYAIVPVYI